MPLTLEDVNPEFGSIYYGTMSSLNCIIVVLFTVPITTLTEKYTSINKMILGNIFEVSGLIIFVLFVRSSIMYYISIIVFSIGEIICTITTTPHITKRIPINYRGRILSLNDFLYYFLYAVVQFIVGYVYDLYGMYQSWIIVFSIGFITTISYHMIKKSDEKAFPDLYKK